jgi:hypothetical protein
MTPQRPRHTAKSTRGNLETMRRRQEAVYTNFAEVLYLESVHEFAAAVFHGTRHDSGLAGMPLTSAVPTALDALAAVVCPGTEVILNGSFPSDTDGVFTLAALLGHPAHDNDGDTVALVEVNVLLSDTETPLFEPVALVLWSGNDHANMWGWLAAHQQGAQITPAGVLADTVLRTCATRILTDCLHSSYIHNRHEHHHETGHEDGEHDHDGVADDDREAGPES